MGEHQAGLKHLEYVSKGTGATWDERKRPNQTNRVWMRVGTTIVGDRCPE